VNCRGEILDFALNLIRETKEKADRMVVVMAKESPVQAK